MEIGTVSLQGLPATSPRNETLITDGYREQNRLLHELAADYGKASLFYAETITADAIKHGVSQILDYGCGKQHLKRLLEPRGFVVKGYDPAMPGVSAKPEPCDYVVCVDVLEHVEPECFISVLKDLHRVTKERGWFSFATGPSKRTLPDGSNTHRIVKDVDWWVDRLGEFFELGPVTMREAGHYSVAVKRRDKI